MMKKITVFLAFVLALFAFGQRTWAQTYITDVMVIGYTTQNEASDAYESFESQGWTGINYNLNSGTNGYYIYLMYKTNSSSHTSGTPITDLYLRVSDSNDAPDSFAYDGRNYSRTYSSGGSNFMTTTKGDLNCGAGGKYIHLYYTKDSFASGRIVTSIAIDNNSNNAVGENGGTSPCDLNKDAGGDYIYMHFSISMTGNLTTVYTEVELRDALTLNNAIIQLGNDIATSSLLEVKDSRTVTIDMNGFTLDRGCTSRGSQVIVIRTGSTLNLSNGTLTGGWGGNGGALDIETGTTVNLTDVIITGNTADDRGGGISNWGTLTMTDCSITNNTSRDDDNVSNRGGGGLFNKVGATATLTNVTISDNLAYRYGGGIRNEGTLTIIECAVNSNECSSSSLLEYDGGGIYNHGTLNIDGCIISSNGCKGKARGYGIWNDATLNLQGNVQIKDNNANDDKDDDDIYLRTGSKITVTGELTGGPGSIGVRMQKPDVFTIGYQSHNSQTDHFFSNIVPNEIVLVNGEAKMRYGYYECSWDSVNKQVVHTVKHIPDNAQIANVCDITNGGVLWGDDYWFIAEGEATSVNGITCNGSDIHLILCDDADYTIYEGFFVNAGTTLHIYSQSYVNRFGALFCFANDYDSQPGIGPKYDDNGITHNPGNIYIHGGFISALGGDQAAGIGGCEDRSSATITIWDGIVNARGGDYGAGIGGGEGGGSTHTIIYGGTVTATGGARAAGIGGGEYYYGGGYRGTIEIYGGLVHAIGGNGLQEGGAGIGSGSGDGRENFNDDGPIIIWGGEVIAEGGEDGAGIGGGTKSPGGEITIHDGIVTAMAGHSGAGIGGGPNANGGNITINGGFVAALAHQHVDSEASWGAAIGGGVSGKGGSITINDGIVFASSEDGAAIGGGTNRDGNTININGGSIVAIAMCGGAGIGGGDGGSGGTITITDGEVMAVGGAKKYEGGSSTNYTNPSSLIKIISKVLLNLRASSLSSSVISQCLMSAAIAMGQLIGDEITNVKYGSAGIGGGRGENGGDVTISGGYVVSHGQSGANAIGKSTEGSSSGTLNISDGLMVHAGTGNQQTSIVAANARVEACRNNPFVKITPCGHKDADSYHDNGDGTYTIHNDEGCQYCGITGTQTLPHTFSEIGRWNWANGWSSGHVPEAGNDVIICAQCEIPNSYIAMADTVSIPYYDTLYIKRAGQLFHSNTGLRAIVEKLLFPYTNANDRYYLFASPMVTSIAPGDSARTNLTYNNYDLYKFDQSETLEWRNYKAQPENFSIDNGIGYLYANSGMGESIYQIKLSGELKPSKEDVTISPDYDPNAGVKGWNLVGNPFACDAYLNDASDESMAFYRMNDDGNGFIAATGAIQHSEGIFVHATAPGQSFKFSRTQNDSSRGGSLYVDLYRADTRSANVVDNAIIRFGATNTLEKFYFNDRNAKLYIPQDDKDYAVVCSDKQGEIPVNFEAKEDGTYKISVKPENVELAYLHLIDNKTGADVDLLAHAVPELVEGQAWDGASTGSATYTFTAKTTDYASRFKLVFASVCEDADGDNELLQR